MGGKFQLSSGRVIALGRLLLAFLFLLAIWIELGHRSEAPFQALVLAVAYLFFSAAILLGTWNDWWLDAKLAGGAHALDIAMFTLMVLLTHGYTSPFFTFFVFLLLSSAIRWGWRATALTAALVAVLYLVAGLLVGGVSAGFDVQHFVVRTGHLVIMSLILIWFGVNQWRSHFPATAEPLIETSSEAPVENVMQAAAANLRASGGALIWRDRETGRTAAAKLNLDHISSVSDDRVQVPDPLPAASFLYDLHKDRALCRAAERNLHAFKPSEVISDAAVAALSLDEGLAMQITSESGDGIMFVQGIHGLSTDHIDLGEQIAASATAQLQRHALLKAAEDRAAARSRISLARDLHDSVVQFLAGAAFRLEALKRGAAAGDDVGGAIEELKQLMLHEQGELRTFIAALRSGSRVAIDDVASELKILAGRLAKHWGVACDFSVEPGSSTIPARLHLDAQQLVREAVANAVRHAGAKSVSVRLAADAEAVVLQFINDGKAYPKNKDGGRMPQSLRERVEDAGGTIELSRGMGVTRLSISLPVAGAAA